MERIKEHNEQKADRCKPKIKRMLKKVGCVITTPKGNTSVMRNKKTHRCAWLVRCVDEIRHTVQKTCQPLQNLVCGNRTLF